MFNFFSKKGDEKKAQDNSPKHVTNYSFLETDDQLMIIRVRCGVLIRSSQDGYLWVIGPFWDISDPIPIAMPEQKIDLIIVLNNIIDGGLPLSSYLSRLSHIPEERIYVTNPDHPHDWHPSYKYPEEVNNLVKVKPLPSIAHVGPLNITYWNEEDYIHISARSNSGLVNFLIGFNLNSNKLKSFDQFSDLKLIGNFDESQLANTCSSLMFHGFKTIDTFILADWINANPKLLMERFALIGMTSYSIGEWKKEEE